MKTYKRCLPIKEGKKNTKKSKTNNSQTHRILVFDTETRVDEKQHLTFGSFRIYENKHLLQEGLFYNDEELSTREQEVIRKYAVDYNLPLYDLYDFTHKIFFAEVYELETTCIGFNLPFDLSRLALRVGCRRKDKRAFTLQLSKHPSMPRISVKHLDSTRSFISFSSILHKRKRGFSGHFLDLKTLASIITQEKHVTLAKACELLSVENSKQKIEEHGKVTPEYIAYNLRDTLATYELYEKLKEEYQRYEINVPMTSAYSAASLGKQALTQLCIRGFFEQNPDFALPILGGVMTTYYGGRVECKIRKTPTKVTVLDFKSMYPTVFLLGDCWSLLTARIIKEEDATQEIRELLENITLEDLQKPKTWKKLSCIVRIQPDNDILPVRANYDENSSIPNIGLNHLTDKKAHWYALPDVIASKLLTGKVPKIKKALKFVPQGRQTTLQATSILGDEINPRTENLFKSFIERRQDIKTNKPQTPYYKSKALALKILANSTSYGIYIEFTPTNQQEHVTVYADKKFKVEMSDYEKTGEHFNPILGTIITSGARLFLAMAEAKLKALGEMHAYMDTDSIFVPPHTARELQEFFRSLNPYSFDAELLEVEKGKENVWFYGISSKRYCLYTLSNGEIIIHDYKLHGIGHLTNPFPNNVLDWQREIWHDIITLHYKPEQKHTLLEKYSGFYAITKRSVTTPELWKHVKHLEINPFNFFVEGQSTDKTKPLAPYSKNPQQAPHEPFIDKHTGNIVNGEEHWQTLDNTFFNYIDHPEHKFENGNQTGEMQRRLIENPEINYIGKEVRNFDIEEKPQTPTKLTTTKELPEHWSRQRKHYWKQKVKRLGNFAKSE